MSRPRVKKFVCDEPKYREFTVKDTYSEEPDSLKTEEYEVIRLIDLENMSQEECAVQMQVSRPTVQILYASARRKVAAFIVNGNGLVIENGDYKLCDDTDSNCMHRNKRNRCHKL